MAIVTVNEIIDHGQAVAKADAKYIGLAQWTAVPAGYIAAQQGDIYFWKLAALPENAVEVTPYRQLAPGQTLGSRHCLASLDGVRMFHQKNHGPLDGPILLFGEPGTVTHPTHGDIVDIPAGAIVQITYQRMYADEVRRVMD